MPPECRMTGWLFACCQLGHGGSFSQDQLRILRGEQAKQPNSQLARVVQVDHDAEVSHPSGQRGCR